MSEQFGLIYNIHPDYVATPNTVEGKRLFQSSIDGCFILNYMMGQ